MRWMMTSPCANFLIRLEGIGFRIRSAGVLSRSRCRSSRILWFRLSWETASRFDLDLFLLLVLPIRNLASCSASVFHPRSFGDVYWEGSLSMSFAQFWHSQMPFV